MSIASLKKKKREASLRTSQQQKLLIHALDHLLVMFLVSSNVGFVSKTHVIFHNRKRMWHPGILDAGATRVLPRNLERRFQSLSTLYRSDEEALHRAVLSGSLTFRQFSISIRTDVITCLYTWSQGLGATDLHIDPSMQLLRSRRSERSNVQQSRESRQCWSLKCMAKETPGGSGQSGEKAAVIGLL